MYIYVYIVYLYNIFNMHIVIDMNRCTAYFSRDFLIHIYPFLQAGILIYMYDAIDNLCVCNHLVPTVVRGLQCHLRLAHDRWSPQTNNHRTPIT